MNTDIEMARVHMPQLYLFPFTPRDVCRSMGLNWLTAIRLHKEGYLSFDPVATDSLNSAQVRELEFIGSLIVAGCNKRMLQHLVRHLKKPYQYQLKLMYYDWLLQQWLLLPQIKEAEEEEEEEEDFFETWLEGL